MATMALPISSLSAAICWWHLSQWLIPWLLLWSLPPVESTARMHLDVLSLAQGWMALPGAQDMLLNLCAPVSVATWWGGHVSAVLSGLDEFRAQCSAQPPGAEYGY